MSSLNNHLKDLGCPLIDYTDHGVKKCMARIKRLKGNEVKQAAPYLTAKINKAVWCHESYYRSHCHEGRYAVIFQGAVEEGTCYKLRLFAVKE